jgi:hypothetical protein
MRLVEFFTLYFILYFVLRKTPIKIRKSLLKTRESNKERQQRYRLIQSNEKKSLSREKNRNNKRLKRKTQQFHHHNHNDENIKSTFSIQSNIITNCKNS